MEITDINQEPLIGKVIKPKARIYQAYVLWVDQFGKRAWAVWIADGNEATPFWVNYPLDDKWEVVGET